MSDQAESKRPRKRPRTIQTTLGFDAERDEDHILLSNVLEFVGTSKDLSHTRQVCRAFRKCSDHIAAARTTALIGGGVKPMIGQSITGLLHAAELADDATRRALKEWNAEESRKQGFDLGLPTKKEENQVWHILAKVPCDPVAPGASVPVTLQLNGNRMEGAIGTKPRLPRGFFHVNAYPGGYFHLCDKTREYSSERTLNDTLCRIKRDLFREDPSCPHARTPFVFYRYSGQPDSLYKEYLALCMNVFSGYELGVAIPKLDLFQKLVETKLELLRN